MIDDLYRNFLRIESKIVNCRAILKTPNIGVSVWCDWKITEKGSLNGTGLFSTKEIKSKVKKRLKKHLAQKKVLMKKIRPENRKKLQKMLDTDFIITKGMSSDI
jgi:hypothetical protein